MSNIEKIKAEIERRKKENMYDELPMTIGRYYEDRDLLSFIDSLPEEKPSEELEEAANEFANQDCVTFISRKKGFIAGAEWHEQQMMKEAVEGEIGYWNQRGLSIRLDQSLEKLGYGEDTEVKIIIVKQDE